MQTITPFPTPKNHASDVALKGLLKSMEEHFLQYDFERLEKAAGILIVLLERRNDLTDEELKAIKAVKLEISTNYAKLPH